MTKLPAISFFLLSSILILSSCSSDNSSEIDEILESGKLEVKNGKGEKDTIEFECFGCKENLISKELLDKVINQSNLLTKNNLNYPLSFNPIKLDLTIMEDDSIFSFENNKKLENVLRVAADYKYIAKNGYGNELEGEDFNTFYIKNGKITNLESEIKLEALKFKDGYINRSLIGTARKSDFIEFTPLSDKSIILKSSLTCVDEGTILIIKLENNDAIKLESWNNFNCEGKSYFDWFNKDQIDKLKKEKIKSLYIYSDGKSIGVNIPKNQSDYFQQLLNLNFK